MRLFICHSSDDKAAVRDLCERLKQSGFEPWLDERALMPGDDWDAKIRDSLRASNAVLVCLSRSAVSKAGYLQKEIRHALDIADEQPFGVEFIFPVKLEPCDMPRRLSKWQAANLYEEGGYDRLVAGLHDRESMPAAAPSLVHRRSRQRWIVPLAACAAVIGLLAFLELRTQPAAVETPASPPAAPVQPPSDMVEIPGGTFLMGRDTGGDPEEAPAHERKVAAFWMDKLPVTNRRFAEFVKVTGRPPAPRNSDELPATNVTWTDAQAFCEWTGRRLPTEAEWEFAARGRDGRSYPWGDRFDAARTNSAESGRKALVPVGSLAGNASPFGVVDMSGNVWQWVRDDFAFYPGARASFDVPRGAKAIRGGSYASDRRHVTTTTRNLERPATRSPLIGFRCAKTP
jgi:formylglycine-generating enzyme required for sulfatase activity